MLLAAKMCEEPLKYCEGWNFGPRAESITPVWDVATMLTKYYGKGELTDVSNPNALHEANLLMLDITKAKNRLGWKPRLDAKNCAILTSDWYKKYKTQDVYSLCVEEIEKFIG
jgi:CDP-glucose 4,6-dehydratase